jgi:formate dehydrogenase subunit gamma
MDSETNLVRRYSVKERINHWWVALTVIVLALSGLAFFHPAFFFLANLLGGGTWARILHPFIGVVMFISFAALAARFWHYNLITDADREWQKHFGAILSNKAHDLPSIGKYNIFQKYLFWTLVLAVCILLVSGAIIWQPYFAPLFPVGLIRLAVLLHALAAFVMILAIIVHVYAAIWTCGSIRAMTRGTVTVAWAQHHHPEWYRQVSGGGK